MDLDQLKQILDLVREHGLSELEIEEEGWRLKVRKESAPASAPGVSLVPPPGLPAPPTQSGLALGAGGTAILGDTEIDIELAVVKSPIVGTFYRSPEPGAASFVEVGATVKKGQVLCIIEAMKLMNEIESEYEGEVVKCYVENGQPVQYGERIFAIKRG